MPTRRVHPARRAATSPRLDAAAACERLIDDRVRLSRTGIAEESAWAAPWRTRIPAARATFAEADEALGESLSRLCWEGPEETLTLTENTQPAILTASIAAYRALESEGLAARVAFMAGHSLGEYSAHVAAGTFSFADAVRMVRRRGRYMQEAVPVGTGAMAPSLGSTPTAVAQACDEAAQGEVVAPANLNGARPGGDCRHEGGGRARRCAREGAGRQARDSAAGERAVPLRADEAGRGAAGAGAARAARRAIRACRWWPTWTPSRSATARRRSRRSIRQVSSAVRWEDVRAAPCVRGRHRVC